MYEAGICMVNESTYNKMISFEDINYQLALEESRDMIFNQFANFLNSFNPSVSIQLCFTNQLGRLKEMEKAISIPEKEDEFNEIRTEFREMLKNQLSKGNNGLKKERYIIFTVEAEHLKQAKVKLERLEIEILSQLKAMGVRAETLDGYERLKIMHDMLNVSKTFIPKYETLEKVLLNSKDTSEVSGKDKTKAYIIPSALDFTPKDCFKLGRELCTASHFIIMASELSDRMLSEILSLEENMYVSMHVQALDQKEVYTEYWKLKNRENYLRRQDAKFGLLPFSSFDEDGHFVENIPDENVDVEKVVQTKMMIDALNSALEKLTKEERELIERIYYRDESLRYLAKLKNISHQAMVKRKNRILEKLREFLADF